MNSGKLPTLFAARKNWALPKLLVSLTILTLASAVLANAANAKSLHPDYQLLRGEIGQYGDWLVGCDNQAECTMIGFPTRTGGQDGAVISMGIMLTIAGPNAALPSVEIFPFTDTLNAQADSVSRPFYLFFGFVDNPPNVRHGYSRATLNSEESAALLHNLSENGAVAGIDINTSAPIVRFPNRDFTRAYRAMQARREGLLEELAVAAVNAPPSELLDGSAMPKDSIPRRKTAVAEMVSGFSPIFTANVCGNNLANNFSRFRFEGGAELWSYQCAGGTSQSKTYWHLAPDSLSFAMPLELPEPRNRMVKAGIDGLENAVFDFDFGILRSYDYQDGHTDCGEFRAWANTNQGWQLIERREMPLCKGLEPNQWIRTYFKPTSGAGQDE